MVGEDAHLPPSVPSRAMSGRMKEEERREHWEPVTKTGIRNISVTMGATQTDVVATIGGRPVHVLLTLHQPLSC